MRGRKPAPSAVKRLRGNPTKRKLNRDEPAFETGIPDAPAHLDDIALMEWTRLTQELASKQVITNVDMTILATYCQTYADWVELTQLATKEERYLKTDKGYQYKNPLYADIAKIRKELQNYSAELGITPSSRSRVKAMKPAKPDGPATPEENKKERVKTLFGAELKLKK
jgi:P27 family predicted phage terminase small subunit